VKRRREFVCAWIARHLPREILKWAVVEAAVRAREPDRQAGDRYCGPDGLTYQDLHAAVSDG
jgi:hypothetical protein